MIEQVRVRVLGGFVLEGVAERELGSLKARRLLKVLAFARDGAVSAERLADILWDDSPPARPTEQVGVLVSRLRRVLGAERLPRTDAGYTFLTDWLDADELAARASEAGAALTAGRLGAARAAADAALTLVRGDVLPDEEGEWVEAERAAATANAAAARRIAADAAGRAGDSASAVALAEQALAHDPYDEAVLRVLMSAHVAAGRPASALAAYVGVRERLADDFGVSPSPETERLHDAIVLEEHDEGGRPAPALAPAVRAATSIVGRDDELGRLDSALARAAETSAAVTVMVAGEAGIGKSALLDAWSASVVQRALVLRGRCDALGRDLPLQPIVDALTSELAARPDSEKHALLGDDAEWLAPLLGTSATVARPAVTAVPADAELGRAHLFSALLGLLTRLADGRQVVVSLDDLHEAGPSTLGWLTFASRRLPALVIVAATGADREPPIDVDVTITLGPLDVAAAAALVGPERAAELHARTGGHPLLLTALRAEDDAGPTSVRDAVERRVRDLGPAVTTVRAAAVLGGEIDLDLLADVLRAGAVDVLDHLEQAAAAGVLVERGAGFAFRHDLEREALDASIGSTRRALVHREAARSLAARPEPDPLAVAVHARLGGEMALAAEWYARAVDIALSRFDLDAAAVHADAAVAMESTSPAAHAARARAALAAGRLDDAADDAARAITAGGGAGALELAGWIAYYRRRYDEASALADEGVERAGDDVSLRVSCLALGGRVRHGRGELAAGIARLEAATAEPAPSEVRGLPAVWLAHARVHEGRPGNALALLDHALVDPDRLAHLYAPLHGRFARVMALGQRGRVAEALAACGELDTAVTRTGELGARMVAPALNVRAWVLRWSGCHERADELNDRAVEHSRSHVARAEAYYAGLLDLADGRVLAGDLDGAAALAGQMAPIADWQGTMAWHQRHRWGLLRARLALVDGDREGAAELCATVADDAAARGARRYEFFARAQSALCVTPESTDLAALDSVVRALGDCAALDGWALVASLGWALGVDAWLSEAQQRAATLVAASPHQDETRALVTRLLTSSRQ